MSERLSGAEGEKIAADYLVNKGYVVVQMNYRSRYGEIDIIAADNAYIVFAEVKTRGSGALDAPRCWVDERKQRRLRSTALLYLAENAHVQALQPRFDVIEVWGDSGAYTVTHIENAF